MCVRVRGNPHLPGGGPLVVETSSFLDLAQRMLDGDGRSAGHDLQCIDGGIDAFINELVGKKVRRN